jgi:hypothetical protein
MIPSSISGPNARAPIGRLFIKVFLWFWLTVLALFAIFLTSRLGTRLIPSRDVIATFAPRVADEAAHAYESGGRQELEQFERSLVGKTGLELYLIRLASATDVNGSVVRAIVNVKYPPAPAKKTEIPPFVPDTRSVEEKLRDAKRSVRSGL